MAWRPVDQEYVETARGVGAAREIETRSGDEARALRRRPALGGTAEATGAAHAHFGEDQRAALLGNQVDLAVPAAPVALDEAQPRRAKQFGAEIFGSRALAVHG